jgi:hypothetical protein
MYRSLIFLLALWVLGPTTGVTQSTPRLGAAANWSARLAYPRQIPGALARGSMDTTADTTRRQIRPTYWQEGGIVGAVVSGGLLGWLGYGLCTTYGSNQNRNCGMSLLAGAVFGGAAGFAIGALVGGQIPKGPKQAWADSADVR